MRLWAIYPQPLGSHAAVDLAPIVRIGSGRAFSLFATDVPRWRPGFTGGRTFLVSAGVRF